MDWQQLNREVIDEFRANQGKVARFGDLHVAILHTVGARSGRLFEVPLIVIYDGDDILIYGTAAGSPTHPSWYYNLRANPAIDVELGTQRFAANIVQLGDTEAAAKVAAMAQQSQQFQQYLASAAPRIIPVFRIERGQA